MSNGAGEREGSVTDRKREVLPKSVPSFDSVLVGSSGQIPTTVTAGGGVLREARNDWLRQ